MKVPYSWLCDFAQFSSLESEDPTQIPSSGLVNRLIDGMNNLGLVVEGVEWIGHGLEGVVVSEVMEIHKIEGADRIRRVVVDADEDEPVQIVCGAFNFVVGDKVPLAKIGAVLPGGFEISKRKMRGVESHGMLCSEIELGIGQDKSGLLILSKDAKVGADIADALGIVPDVVFDLAIENNRPDANCVLGVARDLAAWFKLPFSEPVFEKVPTVAPEKSNRLSGVSVVCPEHCDRLFAALFEKVQPKATPPHIIRRLNMAGMRTVSPIVDISNYLMLELGQPTHPYDADGLANGIIRVRLAHEGEALVTLDGVVRVLGLPDARGRASTDVVITDGQDKAVGLAGIMGGEESEIQNSTSNVLLEIAHFHPMTIARTSKRLGLRSEASARFERGVDPRIIELVLARFTEMLGSSPVEVVEISSSGSLVNREIIVRVSRVNEILGTEISAFNIVSFLTPLGFRVTEEEKNTLLRVVVPTNRPDVEREIDVIEEVARHFGYSRIEKIRPSSKITGTLNVTQTVRRRVNSLAVGMGFYEAWTATLLSPGEQESCGDAGPFIEVENPLAKEESILRRSFLPGLIKALRFNVNRKENELRFFETGKVFSIVAGEVVETERIAFLLANLGDGVASALSIHARISDLLHLRRVSLINRYELLGEGRAFGLEKVIAQESWSGLHPTRSAYLVANEEIVGHVGEIDPAVLKELSVDLGRPVGYLELDFSRLLGLIQPLGEVKAISAYPVAEVDLAFEVPDSINAWEIEDALSGGEIELVTSVKLFDVFRGSSLPKGFRSLAFSVRMSALDHTLSDSEITEIRSRCISLVENRFGAKLRS